MKLTSKQAEKIERELDRIKKEYGLWKTDIILGYDENTCEYSVFVRSCVLGDNFYDYDEKPKKFVIDDNKKSLWKQLQTDFNAQITDCSDCGVCGGW